MALTAAWLAEQYLNSHTQDLDILVASSGNPSNLSVFPAHTLVLVSQSPVLTNMLNKAKSADGKIRKLYLNGHYSPRTVEYFLRYLYTKSFPKVIPVHNLKELLHMADTFDVEDLLTECDKRLRSTLTVDVVCELYEISSMRSLTEMQETCRNFIRANRQTILTNDLHFALHSEQNLMRVFFDHPKAVAEEVHKNMKTRDMELLRLPVLRWQKWISSLKGTYESSSELRGCFSDRKNSLKDLSSSPQAKPTDSSNWIPELYMDTDLCDVEIMVEDDAKFYVHSLVLNKQSEVFLSMWKEIRCKTDLNKSIILKVELKDMDARTTEYMLRFLYTHILPSEISDTNLMNLLSVSHRFEIKLLEEKCIELMIKKLSIHNCCEVLELSERLDLKQLSDLSFRKIVDYPDKIFKNNLHFFLSKQTLGMVLSSLKTPVLLKEYTQWRCGLLGVVPDDRAITEAIDSLIADATAYSKIQRSEERASLRNSGSKKIFLNKRGSKDSQESKEMLSEEVKEKDSEEGIEKDAGVAKE